MVLEGEFDGLPKKGINNHQAESSTIEFAEPKFTHLPSIYLRV